MPTRDELDPRDLAHELRSALTVASVRVQLARRRARAGGTAHAARIEADLELALVGISEAIAGIERILEAPDRRGAADRAP